MEKSKKNLTSSFWISWIRIFAIVMIIFLPHLASAQSLREEDSSSHTITFSVLPGCSLNIVSPNEVVIKSNIPWQLVVTPKDMETYKSSLASLSNGTNVITSSLLKRINSTNLVALSNIETLTEGSHIKIGHTNSDLVYSVIAL